ncbi:MAG: hypothetical protein IKH14_03100 [Prevotella sp.]|nr:hypothetical protein [Prevotella sp.]
MGIFSEGWREKDKMTVRTNPTGEGVPVTTPSQGKGENPSLTLPKGEGNNGNPNNGVVTSVPVQKEGNGGAVTPVVQQATPPVVDPVLAAAQKQVADYDKQIQEMGYRFDGTDPDNMVRYLDTDAGQQAYQRLVADREKAFKYLQDIERLQADDHKYLADWSKDNFYNIITQGEGKNIPLAQAIGDYNLWASKHNGTPLDMYQIYPLLQSKDISKSFEQNVEDEKTRKRKERWQQIGNVLSHMANLYSTIHYAPSQDIEDGRQLTERQQRIWDAERRERNNNVNTWLNLWYKGQQEKARERRDAAYIQLLNTKNNYTLGKKENEAAESGKKQSKWDSDIKKNEAQTAKYNAESKTEEELRPEKVKTEKSKQNANNSTAYKNYQKGSGGKGGSSTGDEDIDTKLGRIAATDPKGYQESLKAVVGYKGSLTGANKKAVLRAYEKKYGNTSSGSNNTPPSRRNNNNNTPPSRRK